MKLMPILLSGLAASVLSASPAAAEAYGPEAEGADQAPSTRSTMMAEPETRDGGWQFTITPYLWMAGQEGTIGIRRTGAEVEVDQSFGDILSDLRFAAMGTFEARNDRLILMADAIYLSVGTEIEGSRDPQFFSGEVELDTFIATGAVGYRVLEGTGASLDLFAGARLISVDADVELEGPLAARSGSASASTVSPLVGARVLAPVGSDLTLGLYGDVGAFVDGADVKWQLMGDVRYRLSRSWDLRAGYRFMSIDHLSDRFIYDIDMSGPFLGASFRF